MEEEVLKIIKNQCQLSSRTVQNRAAKEITSHVMEFIEWLLTRTNYPLIFDIINEENTNKQYQHWLKNVKHGK